MKLLLEDRPGHRALLLGNEAIARGAIEAGLEVGTAYPGTPSTEIADALFACSRQSDLYFEYSINEKVAVEVAAGAAIAGMRAISTMKHVGLNVAADPLNTLPYTGVRAGLVIVTADEPSMHSSINEQDNRYYARLALLPMWEPADPAEALRITRAAFALSEEVELPVMLRTTTRVSHTRGVCELGPLTPRRFQGHFEKNIRWTTVPRIARQARVRLLAQQPQVIAAMARFGFDRIEGDGELGVIASGVAYCYVREVLAELGLEGRVRVLKLASVHPLPRPLIEELLRACRRVLVVEEVEPIVETEVRAIAQQMRADVEIEGKGEGWIPRHWELGPDRVRPAIARFAGVTPPARPAPLAPPELPIRPPMLCAGCSHRSSYYAVKSVVEDDTYFASDIGCYSLGLGPPLNTADSFLCMGGSITMASGVTINNSQPHVAFIGDSTFFHSGLTGLANAVHNRHDLLLVILDNSTTAMTGHQPHPASDLDPTIMTPVDIEQAVRGLGASDVTVVDPNELKQTIEVIQRAYDRQGVRVVISRRPCPLFERRILRQPQAPLTYRVDHDRCRFCGRQPGHEPCGVPTLLDDEILRARTKILTADLGPLDFPAAGAARKQPSAPCSFACPANICAFGYLSLARAGRFDEALALIREQVPLPAVLGRVCHHPCEAACVRGDYDAPLAINQVKRFVAERESPAARERYLAGLRARAAERRSGKRVAVIGAGPAGLTAAHDLTLRGYAVKLFEREAVPGGLLASGIPSFRLPRALLTAEIEGLLSIGVELETGVALGRDFTIEALFEQGFEAICLALGAHRGMRLAVEGEEAAGIEQALAFLRRVNLEDDREVGQRVLVVGGGDAAIDAARTARRLGAREVRIVYRRSAAELPAAEEEVRAAADEGIELIYQTTPVAFVSADGRVRAARCVRTELAEPDRSRRRRPVPVAGSEHDLAADHVIVAVGQAPDTAACETAVALGKNGAVTVDAHTGATSDPRIFAAGDATGAGWTVIAAIAAGKRAAFGIDHLLSGGAAEPLVLHDLLELGDQARYHPPAVVPADRAVPTERPADARASDFDAYAEALRPEQVLAEAGRCLSCGACARCSNCLDNFGCPAIFQRDGQVVIDEVLCVGCGVCAQLCPNDAIVPVRDGGPR